MRRAIDSYIRMCSLLPHAPPIRCTVYSFRTMSIMGKTYVPHAIETLPFSLSTGNIFASP